MLKKLKEKIKSIGRNIVKSANTDFEVYIKKELNGVSGQISDLANKIERLQVFQYLSADNNFVKAFHYLRKNMSFEIWSLSHPTSSSSGLQISENNNEDEKKEIFYTDVLRLNKQSMAFYIEVLPFFYDYASTKLPLCQTYTLLDVGCRTAAGSNLYGELFSENGWGYMMRLVVDSIDLDNTWNDYIRLYPFINNHSNRDLFDIEENSYDICFCSHTIEHLDDPVAFVKQLKKVARKFALITCPYEELDPISVHKTITKEIIDQCKPQKSHIYKSVNSWKEKLDFIIFIV